MAEKHHIRHQAGKVNGIEVIVVESLSSQPGQFQVQLLDTFEGLSEIGMPFVGKGALRSASLFANSIHAALKVADLTWVAEA
jgi:hypothetical protein